jgi:hypothetical protein
VVISKSIYHMMASESIIKNLAAIKIQHMYMLIINKNVLIYILKYINKTQISALYAVKCIHNRIPEKFFSFRSA